MDRSKMITGQVIFRDSGGKTPDGRKLMMLVGIVAVPEGMDIKAEHQYTLCSQVRSIIEQMYGVSVVEDHLKLALSKSGKDLSGTTKGFGLGDLVREPIWRC